LFAAAHIRDGEQLSAFQQPMTLGHFRRETASDSAAFSLNANIEHHLFMRFWVTLLPHMSSSEFISERTIFVRSTFAWQPRQSEIIDSNFETPGMRW
jgi:hypothetical protein